ncbi:hypothetical protein [Rhizobium sp. G21]|uniref:hypothetical protein n=1 Tax=Rhizobium sp. G21 TaxID=2758439 RepID=UPI001602750D|nr:hypothetical protein [Rhizobium sp. G21]MBB1249019.1 hypothetical protein [Rhizobium sp. G21]
MFRISKSTSFLRQSLVADLGDSDVHDIDRFCSTEAWVGDLANGLFQIGRVSGYFHGLEQGECGLLTLLRCYEPNDRVHILELLEDASSSPSSFCFSTYIICGPEERQPVMCVGESMGFGDTVHGAMRGVFIFPRIIPAQGSH